MTRANHPGFASTGPAQEAGQPPLLHLVARPFLTLALTTTRLFSPETCLSSLARGRLPQGTCMCACLSILEENTLPALPGSSSCHGTPALIPTAIRSPELRWTRWESFCPDRCDSCGALRRKCDLSSPTGEGGFLATPGLGLRERREMHTKRLIASSRRPTPPVGDLVCELALGLLVLACSMGTSRSASTPGTLHDRTRRLIVALPLPLLRARPLSAIMGGASSPQRIRLEDATSAGVSHST